jgi:hypothetical protein
MQVFYLIGTVNDFYEWVQQSCRANYLLGNDRRELGFKFCGGG